MITLRITQGITMTENSNTPQYISPTPPTDQEQHPDQEQNPTQNQALEAYLAGYERINSVFDCFSLPNTAENFMPFPPDVPNDSNDHVYATEVYDVDKE
ncbi:MAG: hypothetical protein IIT71_05325 [Acetobacter sp.]|nr:hypothetical protein [Acetobacter sp.]